MDILIREATLQDMDTLLRFEQGVIESERPSDPTLKEGLIHYYDLEEMINSSHIMLLVAQLGEELIGSGYARIEIPKPYLKHKQYAYLGFMYVDPKHRGKGVNKKIIEALEDWAVSQNITEIRLEVYNTNLGAVKAYEKVGFTKHMIEMRLGLKND